ncbi:hypothetical protein [uncultured Aquimarina sp.]|uniref:hypothetical protein n=1 Tax=uncultured Aquimarina sp. TaxID=575652 RepID=UPI0026045754|nr:hypothetical protein [uncultured Aquimarina sp.]
MKKNTKNALKYLLEFVIVTFGVFLGIYVSEQENKKKIKQEREKSVNYILEELNDNKHSLEKAISYHQLIKTQIDSIVPTLNKKDVYEVYWGNEKFKHSQIKGWSGVRLANLENTAFEGAKISGMIQEYKIELVHDISKIYNQQKKYTEFGTSILNRMVNINSSTKIIDVFGSIKLMTGDLLFNEKQLLDRIKKVETNIKTLRNNN